MSEHIIEVNGKRYRRLYYNSCARCALRRELTGVPCPVTDCNDGDYYKEIKEKQDENRDI